jgi:hypothetical protein
VLVVQRLAARLATLRLGRRRLALSLTLLSVALLLLRRIVAAKHLANGAEQRLLVIRLVIYS